MQLLLASHLWLGSAALMSGEEGPSPVKATLPSVPGVDAPGSGLTRPLAGPGSARGRPGAGTHLGSAWPRYDIHYESPGIPDLPHWGFRDVCITSRGKWTLM